MAYRMTGGIGRGGPGSVMETNNADPYAINPNPLAPYQVQEPGIFGSLGGVSSATPALPEQGGILSGIQNLFQDDAGAGPTGAGGMGSGYGPLRGNQKTSLLFAGLRDMVNSFGGQQTDYLSSQGDQFYKQNLRAAQQQVNQQIKAAYAKGDWDAVRAAMVDAATNNLDISHITEALKAGRPQVKQVGDSLVSLDPFSNSVSPLYKAVPKAPAGYQSRDGGGLDPIQGGPADPMRRNPPAGYEWADAGHTRVKLIPGYLEGAGSLSGARRAPKAAGGANAPSMLRHPGSMW